MKINNVKFVAFATYSDGKMKSRWFSTEKAMSNWANEQFRKDDGVTVEVYSDLMLKHKYCTYHA